MITTLGETDRRFGTTAAREELNWHIANSRARKIRTRREFAEQELILPTGPFAHFPFRVHRQPFTGLWLDAMDAETRRFRRSVITGPSQSGKSWIGTVVPVTYHLFEVAEDVGFALPDMNMADIKWRRDILPAIKSCRYSELLPDTGEGSQGGTVKNMVVFKNGATLKFFTAGGNDKSRAGIPCRVMVITEANAFGTSAETSNESTKLEQLYARLLSFGEQALIYLECTVEIETDVIWSHYQAGTASRIACPCPYCDAFVSPEREHLVGWTDAADGEAAKDAAHFICPACEHKLTEPDRRRMNADAVLLHRGQSVAVETKGGPRKRERGGGPTILGDSPRTNMLGFRWSAFNNLFVTAGQLGQTEWEGKQAVDEDAHERKMHQFYWCKPYQAAGDEQQTLDANALMGRQGPWTRGIVPADTFALTAFADIRKRQLHYVIEAWTATGRVHFVDYRWLQIHGDELGTAVAILAALRHWRDEVILPGFQVEGEKSKWVPDQAWVDARFQGENKGDAAVFDFMRDRATERERFRPTFGFGSGRAGFEHYRRPKSTTKTITAIGDGYHFELDRVTGLNVVHIDADYWKGFFHDRLLAPLSKPDAPNALLPGCCTLPKTPDRREHEAIARHWSAERRVREYVPGKGELVRFERLRRTNHFLDGSAGASAAGHFCGVRLTRPAAPRRRSDPSPPSAGLETPDGRPFSILER